MNGADRRISVLHLLHTIAYGGPETIIINWLRKIDRTRFDVHLVCFANPGGTEKPFVEAAERHGIPVIATIPWSRRKPVLKAARTLSRLLRDRRVDILHTHNCYADCVGAVAGWLTPVKTITTLYVWADLGWRRNLIQRVNQFALRFFDEVTAHCEDTRQRSIERGIAPERVRTLFSGFEGEPAALSPDERRQRRQALGAGDDDTVLVNVARMYPEKTQESLLRAFARIHARRPATKLWIAGVGPLEARLRAVTEELGLASSVSFLGFVADLAGLLALADVQVHPAAVEGVPLALCAGMAAGLPIVASAVGGVPEILDEGRNGFLISPGDEAGFVETVLEVIRDPREARRRSAIARHFITHTYSLTAAVANVEQTYRAMLGSPGTG